MQMYITECATKVSDITLEGILLFGFPAMVGVVILGLVLYAVVKNRRDSENDAQPIMKEYAKIIDKPQQHPNGIVLATWAMFETESGKRVRLSCKPNNVYIVGDEGYLTWQGTRLYSFERGKRVTRSNPGEVGASGGVGAPQGYIPAWKRVQMMEEQEQK